jgi:hypothetical protein
MTCGAAPMAGSRHLRRLFEQHLGATPNAVAQTRRLHFAKKLIDETGLPMTQIATGTSRCGHCANRTRFPLSRMILCAPWRWAATLRSGDGLALGDPGERTPSRTCAGQRRATYLVLFWLIPDGIICAAAARRLDRDERPGLAVALSVLGAVAIIVVAGAELLWPINRESGVVNAVGAGLIGAASILFYKLERSI